MSVDDMMEIYAHSAALRMAQRLDDEIMQEYRLALRKGQEFSYVDFALFLH